ncbi:hypothetical protein D3C81_1806050 [compost metagenome]
MFNLQSNAYEIAKGIREDLDMEVLNNGMTITGFQVMSFNYPKEIQDMITKTASHEMVGNVQKYQQISMTDAMASGKLQGGGTASDMAGMMMGINLANEMLKNMSQGLNQNQKPAADKEQAPANSTPSQGGSKPNFCPNCGTKNEGANFCSNCGQKLS